MTIAFPDTSNHNGTMPLQAGTVANLAKATEGTTYRDPCYAHFKAEAQRVGALFGAYHFLREGNGAAQARWAYSVIGPGIPTMIDFEPEYDSAGRPISQPSLADAVAFRDTYRDLGGLVRLNYLPRWYWAGHLGSPSLAALADLALVNSNYTVYSDTGPGWEPYGGLTPAVWQYTDKQAYSGKRVDFNAYRGTLDQLRALLGLTTSTGDDMPLSDDDVTKVATVTSALLRNTQLGEQNLDNTQAAPGHTMSLGVMVAQTRARQADLDGRLDAIAKQLAGVQTTIGQLSTGGVDLTALEALIEQHLTAGSIPGVIAAAVLQHLSAATAGAKP